MSFMLTVGRVLSRVKVWAATADALPALSTALALTWYVALLREGRA
jgi:hypothetical protein